MKKFNTTGLCVPRKHYMVDLSSRLTEIEELVEDEAYFVINRPRQFGKTTTLNELYKSLKDKYTVIKIDFERMSEDFSSTITFCHSFIEALSRSLNIELKKVDSLNSLAYLISDLTETRDIILMIDEVDRISNNELFINFLGVLRSLYLDREAELTTTFKSVILAGVYDIKNLKLKLNDTKDIRYNSPWNIAVDFNINMSFNNKEIASMLYDYVNDKGISMDIDSISSELYKYTGGYPFLVSRLCQIIDENIMNSNVWSEDLFIRGVKILISERNTLIDDLIKNVENNIELREYLFDLIINGEERTFNIHNNIINLGFVLGYLNNDNGKVVISNNIFKQVLYNYFSSKL